MKVSEINTSLIADYLRLENSTDTLLTPILNASIEFIKSYTGLTTEEIDEFEDFPIVVFILCQDMYDNRSYYVDKNNLNKVVEIILGMHCVNFLPTPDEVET